MTEERATPPRVVVCEVSRHDGVWIGSVDELSVFTHARTLGQVTKLVADACALALDIDPAQVRAGLVVRSAEVDAWEQARESEQAAFGAVVEALRADGVTWSDVGRVVEMSPARVRARLNE